MQSKSTAHNTNMPSFSPLTFSPRPIDFDSLRFVGSKKRATNATTSGNQFQYMVSTDGIEVYHPKQRLKTAATERDGSEQPRLLPGIGEVMCNAVADEEPSSTPEGNIKNGSLRRSSFRQRRHLPSLKLVTDMKPQVSVEEMSRAESPKRLPLVPHFSHLKSYEIIREIGNDSEGPCTLIRDRSDGELQVVKSVRWPILIQDKPIEAKILGDILPGGHANIIQLFACDFKPKIGLAQYYFEYCSGGDLHDLCRQYEIHNARFPEPFIWKVFLELTEALEFLHRGFDQRLSDRPGIVHRDIKPGNIFLRRSQHQTAYPDAVIADFGTATLDFATYEPAGTYRWQPQEIPRKSPKGDVWSVGAIVHQMIHHIPVILDLPEDVEPTEANIDSWEMKAEARQPIASTPLMYSDELVDAMFVALQKDHNKRVTSHRMLGTLKYAMEREFPPNSDKIKDLRPLEPWAFDHLTPESFDGSNTPDRGCQQYFEMMDKLWCPESASSGIGPTF